MTSYQSIVSARLTNQAEWDSGQHHTPTHRDIRRLESQSASSDTLVSPGIPKSIARIPVPAPASRTRLRGLSFPMGAKNSLLSHCEDAQLVL